MWGWAVPEGAVGAELVVGLASTLDQNLGFPEGVEVLAACVARPAVCR